MTPAEIKICTSTNFNKSRRHIAEGMIHVADDLREYWPLTVRQVFYQLVAALVIPNRHSEYRKVSEIGTKLRTLGALPWRAIEDRTRRTTGKRGMSDVREFIDSEIDDFLHPHRYGRCYVQKQNTYVEVSTEKDALSSIMEEETYSFCTRLNVVRGQVSATMVEQIASRMDRAIMRGQLPVLLHCGDLDPTGIAIPKAIQRNLSERHGIECDVRMVALTPDQVQKYNLPLALDAIKPKDPNLDKWLRKFGPGQSPVELDALRPNIIREIVRDALMGCYDMDDFKKQKQIESQERDVLREMRSDALNYLCERYPEYFMDLRG
jgi:hypothetical protein